MTDNKEVLVSDEIIKGNYYTKFCGGGLEIGEGTIDCLKREFLEEMNLKNLQRKFKENETKALYARKKLEKAKPFIKKTKK